MIPTTLTKDRNGNWSPRKVPTQKNVNNDPAANFHLPAISGGANSVKVLSARSLKKTAGGMEGSARISPATISISPASMTSVSSGAGGKFCPVPPSAPQSHEFHDTITQAERSIFSHVNPSKINRVEKLFAHATASNPSGDRSPRDGSVSPRTRGVVNMEAIPTPKYTSFHPAPVSNRLAAYDYAYYNNVPVHGLVNQGIDGVEAANAKLIGRKYVSHEEEANAELFLKEAKVCAQKREKAIKNEMEELDQFDERIYKERQVEDLRIAKKQQEDEALRNRATSSVRGSFSGGVPSGTNSQGVPGSMQFGNTNAMMGYFNPKQSMSPVGRSRSMSVVGPASKVKSGDAVTLDSPAHRFRDGNGSNNKFTSYGLGANNNTVTGDGNSVLGNASQNGTNKGAFSGPNEKVAVANLSDPADVKRFESGKYLSNMLAKMTLDEILRVYLLVVCGVGKCSEKAVIPMGPLTGDNINAQLSPKKPVIPKSLLAATNPASPTHNAQVPILSASTTIVLNSVAKDCTEVTAANVVRKSVVVVNDVIDESFVQAHSGIFSPTKTPEKSAASQTPRKSTISTTTTVADAVADSLRIQHEVDLQNKNARKVVRKKTTRSPTATCGAQSDDEEEELIGLPQLIVDVAKARMARLTDEQKRSGILNAINALQHQAAHGGNLHCPIGTGQDSQSNNRKTSMLGSPSATTTIGGSTNTTTPSAAFNAPIISAPAMGFDLFYLFMRTCERFQEKAGTDRKLNEIAAEVLEYIDLDDQERDPLLARVLSTINLSRPKRHSVSSNGGSQLASVSSQMSHDPNEDTGDAFPFAKTEEAKSDAYWAQQRKEQTEAERREMFEQKAFDGVASEAMSVVKGFPSSNRFVRIYDVLIEIGRSRTTPPAQRRVNYFIEMFLPRRQWPLVGPPADTSASSPVGVKGGARDASSAQVPVDTKPANRSTTSKLKSAETGRLTTPPYSAVSPLSTKLTPQPPPDAQRMSAATPTNNRRASAYVQIYNAPNPSNTFATQQRRQTNQRVLSSIPANVFTAEFIERFVSDFLLPKQQADEAVRLHRRTSQPNVMAFFNAGNGVANPNLVGANVRSQANNNAFSNNDFNANQSGYNPAMAKLEGQLVAYRNGIMQYLPRSEKATVSTRNSEDDYYREMSDNAISPLSVNSWLILANDILRPLGDLVRAKHEWFIERTYNRRPLFPPQPFTPKEEMPEVDAVAAEIAGEKALGQRYKAILSANSNRNPLIRQLFIDSVEPFEALLQCSIQTLNPNQTASTQTPPASANNSSSSPGHLASSFLNPFQLAFEADQEHTLSLAKSRNIQQYLSVSDPDTEAPSFPVLPLKTIPEDAAKAMCFAVPILKFFFEELALW